MVRVTVIGDAHVSEGQDLSRFDALGRKLASEQPDVVLSIGDFLSMHSLSHWDRTKRRLMEGQRYMKEIGAGREALERMLEPCWNVGYYPEFVYVEGNHEAWLQNFLDEDPTFEGLASVRTNLGLDDINAKWVPYKDVHMIDGVSFTHVPIMANGKPISNPNPCRKALALFHGSVVFGHLHTLDHGAEHKHGSPHLNQALSVGCFFESVDRYAQGSKTDYWRGIVDLEIYHTNRFDVRTTALSALKSKWAA